MARQTIRTSSLFVRDGTEATPTESTKEVDVGDQEEQPTEVVQEDPTEHVDAANAAANGAANGASNVPRRGRRSATEGQQPQVGPASPTSSAAKGRAKRAAKPSLDLTNDDRAAFGQLALEAVLRGLEINELAEEYRAALGAYDRVMAAARR